MIFNIDLEAKEVIIVVSLIYVHDCKNPLSDNV